MAASLLLTAPRRFGLVVPSRAAPPDVSREAGCQPLPRAPVSRRDRKLCSLRHALCSVVAQGGGEALLRFLIGTANRHVVPKLEVAIYSLNLQAQVFADTLALLFFHLFFRCEILPLLYNVRGFVRSN